MKFKLAFFLLALSALNNLYAQHAYLEEALRIVEQHSLKGDSVDFKKIRKEAYIMLGDRQAVTDCYPVITFILSELKDHHSFFMQREEVMAWKSTSKRTDTNESLPFHGKILDNEIGYITMQGFSSGDSASIADYANHLQQLIKSIDSKKIKGWIVDLRQNSGGNCYPMLAGLGPLLGEGTCGYFVDRRQNKKAWYYEQGRAGVQSSAMAKVTGIPYKLFNANNPIAVLTGQWTASSGEVMVASFRGKANSKSFGSPTAGLSTGNADFTLSDGAMIFLTSSVYADRLGNLYGGKIQPDVLEPFEYKDINHDSDSVIKRAIAWIKEGK